MIKTITGTKPNGQIGFLVFIEELKKLELGDEIVFDNVGNNRVLAYRAAAEAGITISVKTHKKMPELLYAIRVRDKEDLASAFYKKSFIYFAPKLKEIPPKELFEQGKTFVMDLIRCGSITRVYDYPLLEQGYFHNNLFDNEDNFVEEEWNKMEQRKKELLGE